MTTGRYGEVSRRNGNRRGRVRKDNVQIVRDPSQLNPVATYDAVLASWELDSDGPVTSEYDWAVMTVLEALEGLWFEAADPVVENAVNVHVQRIKKQIQESL